MEVNDLQSGRDLNFRVELTKLDLCAKFQLPSFSRDFRAHDLNFPCKWFPNAPPPFAKLFLFLTFCMIEHDFVSILENNEKS